MRDLGLKALNLTTVSSWDLTQRHFSGKQLLAAQACAGGGGGGLVRKRKLQRRVGTVAHVHSLVAAQSHDLWRK